MAYDLRLYCPVKPGTLNQPFGADPAYYSRFKDAHGNPLKGHDGQDYFAPHGTPVFAAHDGLCHFERDSHGGEGMSIHGPLLNGVAPITMYWHLIGDTDPKYPSPIPTDGKAYPVSVGTHIGYADNTGAPYESSGDHLHCGLFWVDYEENTLDIDNGFNGRVNPAPFFTGTFAEDVPQLITKTSYLLSLLKKLVELLSGKK